MEPVEKTDTAHGSAPAERAFDEEKAAAKMDNEARCCVCGELVNAASQMCGVCMREAALDLFRARG